MADIESEAEFMRSKEVRNHFSLNEKKGGKKFFSRKGVFLTYQKRWANTFFQGKIGEANSFLWGEKGFWTFLFLMNSAAVSISANGNANGITSNKC